MSFSSSSLYYLISFPFLCYFLFFHFLFSPLLLLFPFLLTAGHSLPLLSILVEILITTLSFFLSQGLPSYSALLYYSLLLSLLSSSLYLLESSWLYIFLFLFIPSYYFWPSSFAISWLLPFFILLLPAQLSFLSIYLYYHSISSFPCLYFLSLEIVLILLSSVTAFILYSCPVLLHLPLFFL